MLKIEVSVISFEIQNDSIFSSNLWGKVKKMILKISKAFNSFNKKWIFSNK
jgi:hypothetical protein